MYLSCVENVILGDRVNVCGAEGCAGWAVRGVYWAPGSLLFAFLPLSLTQAGIYYSTVASKNAVAGM